MLKYSLTRNNKNKSFQTKTSISEYESKHDASSTMEELVPTKQRDFVNDQLRSVKI